MSKENERIAELEATLSGRDAELKTLYRLVNKYKQTITDLEIAGINKDIAIEDLQARLTAISEPNQAE